MSNLSQILADSNWGQESARINQNFQNINTDLEKVKSATTKFKGYFTTEESLKNKFGSPKIGDTAWVGESYPGTVYDVQTDGQWHNTGKAPDTGSVELQDYAKKAELTELEEKIEGIGEVDLSGLENKTSSIGYVTCDTAAGTAAKVVTVTGLTALTTGIRLLVKMTNNNTASNATLNINGLGAKPLYYNNTRVSGDIAWEAGEIVDIYYDGTNFYSGNFQGGSGEGGNLILVWNTDAATTRKQVKQSDRKSLLQISYKDAEGNPVNEQYTGSLFTDEEWGKDTNWDKIPNQKQITELDNQKVQIDFLNQTFGQEVSDVKIKSISLYGYYTGTSPTYNETWFTSRHFTPLSNQVNITDKDGGYIKARVYSFNSDGVWLRTATTDGKGTPVVLQEDTSEVAFAVSSSNGVVTIMSEENFKLCNVYGVGIKSDIPQRLDTIEQAGLVVRREGDVISLLMGNQVSPAEIQDIVANGYYTSEGNITYDKKWQISDFFAFINESPITAEVLDESIAIPRINIFDKNWSFIRTIKDAKEYIPEKNEVFFNISSNNTTLPEENFKSLKIYNAIKCNRVGYKIEGLTSEVANRVTYDDTPKINDRFCPAMAPRAGIVYTAESTFYMMGASFAIPSNGWFELACEELGVKSQNKAVGSSRIIDSATKYRSNELWPTAEDFDSFDVLVIMHVHNQDVYYSEKLKENIDDYASETFDYATAYDYVIRRYIRDCYNQRNVAESKYYGSNIGKPCQIVLCTHWHDARTIFNASVRKLAAKHSLPLISFDEQIGFSRFNPLYDNGSPGGFQASRIYTEDPEQTSGLSVETIDGVIYGWHPHTGKDKYIQQKMAKIFVGQIK